MAWMRMMGANSVAYHEGTVMGRADDYPGQALDYYRSRGETPLVWGGGGAARGVSTEVIAEIDDRRFGLIVDDDAGEALAHPVALDRETSGGEGRLDGGEQSADGRRFGGEEVEIAGLAVDLSLENEGGAAGQREAVCLWCCGDDQRNPLL